MSDTFEGGDVRQAAHHGNQVARLGAVDVPCCVRSLTQGHVHRQEVRLAGSDEDPHAIGLEERAHCRPQPFEEVQAAVLRQHCVPFSHGDQLSRDLTEEVGQLVLLNLALREPMASPIAASGGNDGIPIPGIEDPRGFVFGFRKTSVDIICRVVVPIQFLNVDGVADPLRRLDLIPGLCPAERQFHPESMTLAA